MALHANVSYSETRSRPDELNRLLALGGVIGPAIFVLTFTVAGLMRPDYSPLTQAISDLGVGENAWALNGSLVLLGLLLVGFAVAFHRAIRPEASALPRLPCAVL